MSDTTPPNTPDLPLLLRIATAVAIDAQTFGLPHHSNPAQLNLRLRQIIARTLSLPMKDVPEAPGDRGP